MKVKHQQFLNILNSYAIIETPSEHIIQSQQKLGTRSRGGRGNDRAWRWHKRKRIVQQLYTLSYLSLYTRPKYSHSIQPRCKASPLFNFVASYLLTSRSLSRKGKVQQEKFITLLHRFSTEMVCNSPLSNFYRKGL